ncbi:MAG: outer membrane beta-barrel protein [Bacteroidales bacterium]
MIAKIFTGAAIFLLVFTQASGQGRLRADTRVHPGLTAGVGLNTIVGNDYWGNNLGNKFLLVFNGGGNVNIPLPFIPDLYVQPGVLFSVKGARKDIIDTITRTVRLSYIEVPVNVLFRPQLGDGHMLLGAGPYAAFGVVGKERTKTGARITELTVKYTNDVIDKPTTYVYYRGFDAGANIFIGYELFSGIFFQMNGQFGLLKINPDYKVSSDKAEMRNFGFNLSAGYRFQ